MPASRRLVVKGSLALSDYTALTTLPPGLCVKKNLYLRRCTALTTLPQGVHVTGYLDLFGWTALTTLASGLSVENLRMRGCTALTTLPSCLSVKNNLYLEGCAALTTLPADLDVKGSVFLLDCTALTTLPPNPSVKGTLYLRGSNALTTLPADLSVEEDLYLVGSTALTTLPLHLGVKGNLHLVGCTALTELPPELLRWPRRPDGQPHDVVLENTGLSDATRQRLEAWASGQDPATCPVRFHWSQPRADGQDAFGSLHEAWAFWSLPAAADDRHAAIPSSASTSEAPPCPGAGLDPEAQQTLRRFLGGLRFTAEFRNARTAPHLRQRVRALGGALATRTFAATAVAIMEGSLETCGDRLVRGLGEVELAARLEQAMTGEHSLDALRELATALLKLQVVHAHAKEHVARQVSVDEVEIVLHYETALAPRLGLPVATQEMLYPGCARSVTAGDLARAEAAARTAAASPRDVANFLADFAPWQRALRQQTLAQVRFAGLVPAPRGQRHRDMCVLTLALRADLVAPVVILRNDTALPELAEFDALVRWYLEKGTSPADRTPFTWDQVRRLA